MPEKEKDMEEIAKMTREFVSSAEGQKSIKAALESASKAAQQLYEASQVDPKKLDEPITL